MLAAEDVCVQRGPHTVLDAVDMAVAPGELVAVIGPNGAGKSTLLHALSGANRIDAGAVRIDGHALSAYGASALARRRAVLPQTPELGFPLSVREVVALGRGPHAGRTSRAEDARVLAEAMAETGVTAFAGRAYPGLSGGERQRVQLARVLAQVWPAIGAAEDSCYLLLDEPTNNLDIAHQQHIIDTAGRLSRRGHGVLAVLHDPNLAASRADRIVVLAGGRVVRAGPPTDVLDTALLESVFGIDAHVRSHPDTGRPYMLPA